MDFQISVLITFYNQEEYVDRAIDSVMSQNTLFPFVVLIGDDGSTDSTIEKIMKWEEKYKDRIFHIVQNRSSNEKYIAGSRASRNRMALLELVKTPYFIFLDGDDYWTDTRKLQKQYEILEKKENNDCIGCAHGIMLTSETNGIVAEKKTVIPRFLNKERKYSLKKYWSNYYFHTDTILFRSGNIGDLPKEILRDFFNDNIITFTFMQFGSMYYLPDVMAVYRMNEKGLWVGEKKAINAFREILSFDIVNLINSRVKMVSSTRYNAAFRYYEKNKNEFVRLPTIYKELAQNHQCTVSLRATKGEPLFSKIGAFDWIIVKWFQLCFTLKSIKKAIIKH